MKLYSAEEVARRLPYPALIECLRRAFAENVAAPLRSSYEIAAPSGASATYMLMPAWRPGEAIATKLLTILPQNAARGLPTIHALIVLFDGDSGAPIAVLDGTEVTRRRTAAASALAASYLARERSERLLVVGTGPQAFHQALAHAAVRPIRRIEVWGRSAEKASALAAALQTALGSCSVQAVAELEPAVTEADVISCATSATEALIRGGWLRPGAFLDLVGNHRPQNRECDDEAVRRSRVYVDTRAGALAEAGELLIPLRAGILHESDIQGDLAGLCRGEVCGRGSDTELTLFKSVGAALEDLAAAQLVASGSAGRG